MSAQPFTAATVASIAIDGEYIGSLVSRDAGTFFEILDSDGRFARVAAARLTVAAGTRKLKDVVGYIDEVGEEFSRFFPGATPARATGRLCGKRFVEYLMGDDDDYDDDFDGDDDDDD